MGESTSQGMVLWAVQLAVLISLLVSSQLWNRAAWLLPMIGGSALAGVGVLFKLQHYPYASALLLAGAGLLEITYLCWYSRKPEKQLLDHLKLAWVLSVGLCLDGIAIYRSLVRPAASVAAGLFWATALLYIYERWVRRPN